MARLAGKVAVITGAGSGIGKATAFLFAREGASVGICDIDPSRARDVRGEVEKIGARATSESIDIADLDQVTQAFRHFSDALGPIDILVNNAGIDIVKPFIKSTPEEWERIIAVNYRGTINCTRAVLDEMIARGSGKIVSVVSDAGRVGSSGEVVYSGSKGAIIAFSKALAREVARYHINVNCVSPGPTQTAIFEAVQKDNPKLMDAITKQIPLGRIGQPEDVAPAILFFASSESDFITGQTLSVSGGLSMM